MLISGTVVPNRGLVDTGLDGREVEHHRARRVTCRVQCGSGGGLECRQGSACVAGRQTNEVFHRVVVDRDRSPEPALVGDGAFEQFLDIRSGERLQL